MAAIGASAAFGTIVLVSVVGLLGVFGSVMGIHQIVSGKKDEVIL